MAGVAGIPGTIRQGVLPDILSLQKDAVWMRGLGVDSNLVPVERQSHLYAPTSTRRAGSWTTRGGTGLTGSTPSKCTSR